MLSREERRSHIEGQSVGVKERLQGCCVSACVHSTHVETRRSIKLDHDDHGGGGQANLMRRDQSGGIENVSGMEIGDGGFPDSSSDLGVLGSTWTPVGWVMGDELTPDPLALSRLLSWREGHIPLNPFCSMLARPVYRGPRNSMRWDETLLPPPGLGEKEEESRRSVMRRVLRHPARRFVLVCWQRLQRAQVRRYRVDASVLSLPSSLIPLGPDGPCPVRSLPGADHNLCVRAGLGRGEAYGPRR